MNGEDSSVLTKEWWGFLGEDYVEFRENGRIFLGNTWISSRGVWGRKGG